MFNPILSRIYPLSIKSFIMASLACLFTLGGLSGCQSTTGISTNNSNATTSTVPVLSKDDSNPDYNDEMASSSQTSDDNSGIKDSEINDSDTSNSDTSNNDTSGQIVKITPLNETPILTGSEAHSSENVIHNKPPANINTQTNTQSVTETDPDLISEPSIVETLPDESIDSETYIFVDAPEEPPVIRRPPPDTRTIQQRLLEQARQNSQQSTSSATTIQNGDNIPAFKRLMDTGVTQLRNGQISAAQSTFTRAQRLAPQSSAVYFYLGQVALKQNQPLKAEAMARRGLVVAQSSARKKALWQVILKAGQSQGNIRVIKEATKALGN